MTARTIPRTEHEDRRGRRAGRRTGRRTPADRHRATPGVGRRSRPGGAGRGRDDGARCGRAGHARRCHRRNRVLRRPARHDRWRRRARAAVRRPLPAVQRRRSRWSRDVRRLRVRPRRTAAVPLRGPAPPLRRTRPLRVRTTAPCRRAPPRPGPRDQADALGRRLGRRVPVRRRRPAALLRPTAPARAASPSSTGCTFVGQTQQTAPTSGGRWPQSRNWVHFRPSARANRTHFGSWAETAPTCHSAVATARLPCRDLSRGRG